MLSESVASTVSSIHAAEVQETLRGGSAAVERWARVGVLVHALSAPETTHPLEVVIVAEVAAAWTHS